MGEHRAFESFPFHYGSWLVLVPCVTVAEVRGCGGFLFENIDQPFRNAGVRVRKIEDNEVQNEDAEQAEEHALVLAFAIPGMSQLRHDDGLILDELLLVLFKLFDAVDQKIGGLCHPLHLGGVALFRRFTQRTLAVDLLNVRFAPELLGSVALATMLGSVALATLLGSVALATMLGSVALAIGSY